MTTKTKPEPKEKKELIWTSQEKENHKSEYGCEIIIENGTLEQVSTTNAPSDACIVTYEYNEKVCRDLQDLRLVVEYDGPRRGRPVFVFSHAHDSPEGS